MRLIDADALIEKLDDFNKWCKDGRLQGSLFVADVVGDMSTVCDIDVIRAEIDFHATTFIKGKRYIEKDFALDIIDKHFKGA